MAEGVKLSRMLFHLFQSGLDLGMFGFTLDEAGLHLPPEWGPWRRQGRAGIPDSASVLRVIEESGFFLARSRIITGTVH
jgi:hypothetical protein